MHSCLPGFDNLCRFQQWQRLQPETCGLDFPVSELPRLNNLVRLADAAADNTDRILQRNHRDGCVKQLTHKVDSGLLLHAFAMKPTCATHSQMRTWRMRDHQIP